mgnify:CR=1 FL=1
MHLGVEMAPVHMANAMEMTCNAQRCQVDLLVSPILLRRNALGPRTIQREQSVLDPVRLNRLEPGFSCDARCGICCHPDVRALGCCRPPKVEAVREEPCVTFCK